MSFSLRAVLGLDNAGFESGLLLSEKAAKASGKKIREGLEGGGESSGYFGRGVEELITNAAEGFAAVKLAEKIADVTQETIEMGKAIRDTSIDLGVSANAVQVYERAFDGLERVRPALDKLAEAKEKALAGGADAEKLLAVFDRFGISAEELQKASLEQLFAAIGENIKGSTIDAAKLADEMEVLGARGGTALNAGFKKGLTEVNDELVKTNSLISATELAALKQLEEDENVVKGVTRSIASKVITGVVSAFDALTGHNLPGDTGVSGEGGAASIRAGQLRKENQARWDEEQAAQAKATQEAAASAAAKIANAQQLKDLDRQRAEIEEQTREKGLTADEKRLELVKERNELTAKINDTPEGLEKSQMQLRVAQLNDALADIKPDRASTRPEHIDVNAAERVGAFTYQAQSASEQQKANAKLDAIHRTLESMNQKEGVRF